MVAKITVEIDNVNIGEAIDEFVKIRRQLSGKGRMFVFKRGSLELDASDLKETPMQLFERYQRIREIMFRRRIDEVNR